MKPNEEDDIDKQNIIVQLGMLILKGRSNENIQVSGNDVAGGPVKTKDLSFHYEKETFLSLWKCCDIVFIEVWLHHNKLFNEDEAVQGHCGYLLIEQWQIEMTKNSCSETGFHCTEKMLMQAIKSKLYFSQLSAWLNLSKGKFPRYTHFRLCRKDSGVASHRFCKPPEIHQFPRVHINTTKELRVSLHSLPRFDISKDYPVFSWVFTDSAADENNEGSCDYEFASPEQNKTSFGRGKKDCVMTSSAVRRLEFPAPNSDHKTGVKYPEDSTATFPVKPRTYNRLSAVHPTSSESLRCGLQACATPNNIDRASSFSQCDIQSSRETKYTSLERTLKKYTDIHCGYAPKTAVDSINNCAEEGLKSRSSNSSTTCAVVDSYGNAKNLDSSFVSCSKPLSNVDTAGNNSTAFKTRDCTSYRNSCSPSSSNDINNLKHDSEYQPCFTDELYIPSKSIFCDRECSSSDIEKLRLSKDYERRIMKGNVSPKTKKDFDKMLPGVRHLIEDEVKRKLLNEKLWECLSPEKRCCHGDMMTSEGRKCSREKYRQTTKDNLFTGQPSTISCHAQLPSRQHFRHASTGTLPVFHPSTGLPISSSPAPFRKTQGLTTVDDIHSSPYNSFNLRSLSNVLSRSAPTLTAQKLLGNFEESVLNDRLLPDGVVEGFFAELSASSSRKCLSHVTLPVQAYFFKLSDDNAPSPYMGYISLHVPELPRKGYHVPKKGTIQLTLFNPNQSVVQVFVVLYDFSDMQPNFQTFLRQKTTSLVESDELVGGNHDNLHYLIHLRFASSKSGRVYLHTDIRVIFARHPPDRGYLKTTTSGPTNPKYVPRRDT